MPTFRKQLCDSIRPHLKGKKISSNLVRGLDEILDRAGVPRDDGGAAASPAPAGSPCAYRRELTDLMRPDLATGKFSGELVAAIDELLDRAGCPRDDSNAAPAAAPKASPRPSGRGGALPPGRLDVAGLRAFLGLPAAGSFDKEARQALLARLSNKGAPAVSEEDFQSAASDLGVSVKHIKAVREVEVRKKPFDDEGRPTILFERHIFARHCVPKGCFNASHPAISGRAYGRGGYGPASGQYGKLADACALDPEAAFRACSWGAFQVMGMHGPDLGYGSAVAMGFALTASEAAHLDCFLRFLRVNSLVDELRACRAGNPASCVPFVRRYNGEDFAKFDYHKKLAAALA